ncbi:hypothetical protein GCM10023222_20940 [Saccharopolyspora cebuensis]
MLPAPSTPPTPSFNVRGELRAIAATDTATEPGVTDVPDSDHEPRSVHVRRAGRGDLTARRAVTADGSSADDFSAPIPTAFRRAAAVVLSRRDAAPEHVRLFRVESFVPAPRTPAAG